MSVEELKTVDFSIYHHEMTNTNQEVNPLTNKTKRNIN
jgi:hypothetical protein